LISSPCRLTLAVLVLQCSGCAADKAGTDLGEVRPEQVVRQVAPAESGAARPYNESSSPLVRAALADSHSTRDPSTSPFLATESTFIVQDSISVDRSGETLEDDLLFSSTLERMREEERTSLEAQQLAKHHKDVLERAVGELGVVDDLTCGLSLCMGSVTSLTSEDHDAWGRRLAEDPAARRYGAIHRYESSGNQLQNRFMFSADPAVAAIFMSR